MAKETIFSADDVETRYAAEKIVDRMVKSLETAEQIQQLGFSDALKVDVTAVAEAKEAEIRDKHPDAHDKFVEAQVGRAVNEAIQEKRIQQAEFHDLANIVTAGAIEELSILTEKANEKNLGIKLGTTVTYVYGEGSDQSAPTPDDLLKIKVDYRGETVDVSIPAMLMKEQQRHFDLAAEGKIESQTMAEHKQEVQAFLQSEQGVALQEKQSKLTRDEVYSELDELRETLIEFSPVLANSKNVQIATEDYMVTKYVVANNLPEHSRDSVAEKVTAAISADAAKEESKVVGISEAVRDRRAGLQVA